jgi:hypothetical protein
MAQSLGNFIANDNVGQFNNPMGGVIGVINGVFRLTTTVQTVITARVPTNPVGNDQVGASWDLGISPNLIIPTNAYVFEVGWFLPKIQPNASGQTFSNNIITGTATDKLKVATVQQGVTSTVANSLGGVSGAVQTGGNFLITDLDSVYGKIINPYNTAAAAITGTGAYSGTAAQNTVQLFSVDTTDILAGSGISVANLPSGQGYPQFLDVPVWIKYWFSPVGTTPGGFWGGVRGNVI